MDKTRVLWEVRGRLHSQLVSAEAELAKRSEVAESARRQLDEDRPTLQKKDLEFREHCVQVWEQIRLQSQEIVDYQRDLLTRYEAALELVQAEVKS